MFANSDYLMEQNYSLKSSIPAEIASNQAMQLFREASLRGKISQIASRLLGRSSRLYNLSEVVKNNPIRSQHYAGLRTVLVKDIIGTEGRSDDFDASFNPLHTRSRSRWQSVARGMLQGQALPAVELIQVGQVLFVRDGHHRISVAKALGQEAIEAEVTVLHMSRPLPWERCPQAGKLTPCPASC